MLVAILGKIFPSLGNSQNVWILESLNLSFVSALIQFFFPLLISSIAGLSEFGAYTLIFQQALFLRLFIGFALEEVIGREMPLLIGENKQQKEFVKVAIFARVAIYALTLAALCFWIFAIKQSNDIEKVIQVFTIYIFSILLDSYISSQGMLRSMLYLKRVELAELLFQLCLIILSLIILPFHKNAYSIVAVYSAVLLVFSLVNLKTIFSLSQPFSDRIHISYSLLKILIKKIHNYGLPLLLASLLYWVISVYDRFQIGFLLDNRSAGIYALGAGVIVAPLNLIVFLPLRTLQPLLFAKQKRLPKFLTLSFLRDMITFRPTIILVSAISLFVLCVFMASIGTSNILEKNTGLSMSLVIGLLIAGLSQGGAAFVTYLLKYERKSKFIALSLCVPCIFVWFANPFVIRNYGITGAAYFSAFGFCLFALIQLLFVRMARSSSA